jgi:Uma2 family endonuclease
MLAPIIPKTVTPARWQLLPEPKMTDEDFLALCQANPDMRLERTAEGAVIIMPPAGAESSERNADLTVQVGAWSKRDGTGRTFDSSGGFTLPNGAIRSPDVAWVRRERWDTLTPAQKAGFAPLCPDFVIELRSGSDRLRNVQRKLEEYIANGATLGWLIDPQTRTVHVYRPDRPVEKIERPSEIRGDPELPGLVVDLAGVWDPDA